MSYESPDEYYELYKESKITIEELRQHPESIGMSDEELEVISDQLFDLAIAVQKIISEL